MEGKTESQVTPKRKKKKKKERGKRRNQNATDHGFIGMEIKGKRKQGRKMYLKGEGLGSAAAHKPPGKATANKKSKWVGG